MISGVSTSIMDKNNGAINLTKVGNMDTSVTNATRASDCDRLSLLKSQAKWTCLNRMDFGLNGITKALNLPMLGKRGVELNKATDLNSIQEDHSVK